MRQHIYKVDYHHIEVVLTHILELLHQFLAASRVIHLVIREGVAATITLQLGLNERCLIEILAFVLVFIHPEFGKHLGYLLRHQSAKDGITSILCSCRQNRRVEILVYVKHIAYLLRQHPPLIIAEIVDDDEENLLSCIEQWEYLVLEHVGRKHWALRGSAVLCRCHPVHIVPFYKLAEAYISLFLLHSEHFCHRALRRSQLQFPSYQCAIDVFPVIYGPAVGDLHGYILEILLITSLRHLRHYLATVYVFLQRKEYLHRVYRLDEIVGYLRTDGLVHDILFLALRHHDDRSLRLDILYALKRLQSCQTGHHLVEKHEVESLLLALLYGVNTIAYSHHFVAFLFQKNDMGVKMFYLVIDPK